MCVLSDFRAAVAVRRRSAKWFRVSPGAVRGDRVYIPTHLNNKTDRRHGKASIMCSTATRIKVIQSQPRVHITDCCTRVPVLNSRYSVLLHTVP